MEHKETLLELLEAIAADDPEGIEDSAAVLVQHLDHDDGSLGLKEMADIAIAAIRAHGG